MPHELVKWRCSCMSGGFRKVLFFLLFYETYDIETAKRRVHDIVGVHTRKVHAHASQ